MTELKVKEYLITVKHLESGSSSSFGDVDLYSCLRWALDWAGVEVDIEAIFENGMRGRI